MKKQLLSLLLACACLTLLPACGNEKSDPAAAGADSQPAVSDSTPDPEPEQEPVPDPEAELLAAAIHYANNLPLESQIAQMFFARCPETGAAELAGEYDIGGYILFGRDFEGQTADSVSANIQSYQDAAATPMLIGVDEEGGTVVRVSSNPNLRSSQFRSPQSLYNEGGLTLLLSDTQEKDALLSSLGINVNLAPVCDVSTDPNDFIYSRSMGLSAEETGACIESIVSQMSGDGMGSVLKHFPGYGSNVDTHTGIAHDTRPLELFWEQDLIPFQNGIAAGADGVLVCHNIVGCMDENLPASLSPNVHALLRDELGFDGVIMTDDLVMDAITQYTGDADAAVLAVKAGNDMLISSDFVTQFNAVLDAVNDGSISADRIRESVIRIIKWKMELGLLSE